MNIKNKCYFSAFSLATIIFVVDQWSKFAILAIPELTQHSHIEITSFFNLVLVYNYGISFGMFAKHDQPLILSAVALLIVLLLLRWLTQNTSMMVALGIGSVIGGALGNVVDRFQYGAVVDFLDFHISGFHWPAFNVADSSIFIGVVILCIHSIFFEHKNQPKE